MESGLEKRSLWRRLGIVIAAVAGMAMIVIGIKSNPMLLIYPMWLFVYLFRKPLQTLCNRAPLWFSFMASGVLFGMLTELFAIFSNLPKPPEERILLSPDPVCDLVFGFFYYFFVIGTWYLLMKRRSYPKWEVFFATGVYGIFTEEMGQVFLRIFSVPIYGFLYALIVATVYGIFPMLACLLNNHRFRPGKKGTFFWRFVAAIVALFVQWAVYGIFVLPLLKGFMQG